MDIHAMNSRQLSQLAQLGTDELADKCFVPTDEVGKDGKIGGRSVRLATKAETDSATNLAMRNQILKSLGENYDIRGFEDEVRGLLGIPKEGGDASQASGENLVDAARVRDVVRYVQAKSAKVDEILDKVLVKVKFSDRVKAVLGKTLVSEASNDIVSKIINAEPPTLDDLTRLCKLAAQTHPQDTFEDKLAVAYLKGFSATIKGDVPTVSNLATRMEQLKAAERKGVADHQAEEEAGSTSDGANFTFAEGDSSSGVAESGKESSVEPGKDSGERSEEFTEIDGSMDSGSDEILNILNSVVDEPDEYVNPYDMPNPSLNAEELVAQGIDSSENESRTDSSVSETNGNESLDLSVNGEGSENDEFPKTNQDSGFLNDSVIDDLFSENKEQESEVKSEGAKPTVETKESGKSQVNDKSANDKNPLKLMLTSRVSEMEELLKSRLGDDAKTQLDFIDQHAEKSGESSRTSFKEAVSCLLLDKLTGKGIKKGEIQNQLFQIVGNLEGNIPVLHRKLGLNRSPATEKFYLLCVKFVSRYQNEILGKLPKGKNVEQAIAEDFKQKVQDFIDGRDTSLYGESVHDGLVDDDALELLWNKAIEALRLKDAKLDRKDLEGFSAKESKFDLVKTELTEEASRKTVIRQSKGSNMCYIKSPINGLLAAGQLQTVKSALTPDENGTYHFALGAEVSVPVEGEKDKKETLTRISVTAAEIKAAREGADGKVPYTDVELALFLAHNRIAEKTVGLGEFGEADRVVNCFGYQRPSDLRGESKISINRSGITDRIKEAKYRQDGLGAAMKKVYDAGQWLDRHKDGVLLLNISERHFVAVTGTYYTGDNDFGFIVRDSAGGNVRTVNVRESGEMFMLDAYVPNEYKPLM